MSCEAGGQFNRLKTFETSFKTVPDSILILWWFANDLLDSFSTYWIGTQVIMKENNSRIKIPPAIFRFISTLGRARAPWWTCRRRPCPFFAGSSLVCLGKWLRWVDCGRQRSDRALLMNSGKGTRICGLILDKLGERVWNWSLDTWLLRTAHNECRPNIGRFHYWCKHYREGEVGSESRQGQWNVGCVL